MSVSLDIKKISKEYGIKQSDWNALFNRRPKPYYFYYKDEYDLRNEIKKHTNIFDKDCKWAFKDIGHHTYDSGFFGKSYYVSCSNCSKGQISGSVNAKTAVIKIVKEDSNPSNPKNGFFNSDILEQYNVLWSIELNMKCDKCNKNTIWYGLQNNDSESTWGFADFEQYLSEIK